MTETREITVTARAVDTAADGRTVEVLAVPFGETTELMGGLFREEFAPDVEVRLRDAHALPMLWRHSEVIGAWQKDLRRADDGLHAVGRISDTALGRDVATLLADQASSGASIGFRVVRSHTEQREQAVELIDAIELLEISLTPIPQYTGARLESVRERMETPPMTDTLTPELRDLAPRVEQIENNDTLIRETLAELREQIDRMATAETHPLARYRSFADYATAVYRGDEQMRALSDQVTGDNPGVAPPGWLSEIAGIVDRPRVAINAFGSRGLPDSGMEVDWPYLDPALDLDALVATQAAEKTEINSTVVKILKGSQAITTGAAGSDVSYQLIMRSSPSYLDAYLRVLANAFGRYQEAAMEAVVEADATGSVTGGAGVLTDKATAAGAILEASAAVDDATGAPAGFVLAAPDVWLALGGLFADTPPAYGTQNTPGVAQASTLRVEVSGLPILRGRFLTAGKLLVSNDLAADYLSTGPMIATAEDVAKLGRNVAIWGMGTEVVQYPAGVVAVSTA